MAETAAPFTIKSFTAGDGYSWRYRHYPPMGAPRARVVCIHGIQSHAGWYEHSCRRMAEEGYEVFFLDRRGSGVNQQDRGDTPSFRRLLDDLAEFLGGMSSDARPARALYLVAISWGGKLAVALQRRHPGLVDGLVLLCPGICPRIRPSLRQRLAVTATRLVNPRRLFPIPLNDPQLFTATPHWRQFIATDPLSLHQATARFLVESVRLDLYLSWAPRHVRVPVLLQLAGRDQIIDNEATRRYVARFATADQQVIEYADAQHTLEFEPDPERHIADLLQWLRRQAGEANPAS